MSTHAIRAAGISKCYRMYARPQDRLIESLHARLSRLLRREPRPRARDFWALRDVDITVERGTTVGIIGRNGSGKSTLLQVLCGTVTPSSGRVDVRGRVAAMLELGSGFNPEFTGRENVFLNAQVLGLERAQVEARFGSIEAFADIGPFIDEPVKTYSSGMLVRLAFAVMAHVDADILVIDEALAVGDAVFAQKCMRFLRRFRERGTVLFVSHDASAVVGLCSEAIWLEHGQVRLRGPAKEVAEAYAQQCAIEAAGDVPASAVVTPGAGGARPGAPDEATRIDFFGAIADSEGWSTGQAQLEDVALARVDGVRGMAFSGGEQVVLTVRAQAHAPLHSPIIGFFVKDRLGQSLFGHNTYDAANVRPVAQGATLEARFIFHLPLLPDGEYSMTVAIADGDPDVHVQHHWLHDAALLSVRSTRRRYGLVGIPFDSITLDVRD